MSRTPARPSEHAIAVSRSVGSLRLLLPLLVLGFAACIGDTTPPCAVSAISVGSPSATVAVGQSIQATASFTAQNCSPPPSVVWSSENNAIVTVSSTGLITGVSVGGPVSIRATVNSNVGSRPITVVAGP